MSDTSKAAVPQVTETETDVFSDLSKLRLDLDYLQSAGVKKVLTTIPVRKPRPQDFVRTHPQQFMSAALVELKDDREIYLVIGSMVEELAGEYHPAILFLAITRQGGVFLWPVKVPGESGKQSDWHRSALKAAHHAKTKWVRVRADMSQGMYEVFEATATNIPEPDWPDKSLEDLLRIAFKDRLIADPDHIVVKKLRGLV
jgi:hypothetical protein